MRVWITFGRVLGGAAPCEMHLSEYWAKRAVEESPTDLRILPVDLDDGEIAGLFAPPCEACRGRGYTHPRSSPAPISCDACNGTGEEEKR